MNELRRTVLHDRHLSLGAKMVEFAGWEMPIFYPTGIVGEHLATRKGAGLFDVSHMGRFTVRGADAVPFLQHVLTNNVEALEVGQAQYTIVPNETGGAIDDAYLYRFVESEYLLVVNAANRQRDWDHFQSHRRHFDDVELTDCTADLAMIAIQGPQSRWLLQNVIETGGLPEPMRNELATVTIGGAAVRVARTGYTGEPLGFELFVAAKQASALWDRLVEQGAEPVGLGARDTLRLEAGLPLYGHELGADPRGNEIPIFATPLAKFVVSFSRLKGRFVGREPLGRQRDAFARIVSRDYSLAADLPRLIHPVTLTGRGVAREGAEVYCDGKHVGYVTSGTMVPCWTTEGEGLASRQTDKQQLRPLCLAYLDADIVEDDALAVQVRGKRVDAVVVGYHLRGDAPPYARSIVHGHPKTGGDAPTGDPPAALHNLLEKAAKNTVWRQRQCINLIPSEMTTSPAVRLLSVMDPAFRYAEHRQVEAFYDADIFYYQGTDFIGEVERLLEQELRTFLGCREVETRVVSGQMANVAVFSAMLEHLNRADPKAEPRRIGPVMNQHIGKGGHLSSQPMGALRDYVARDPRSERPAVVNFPVREENPYQVDVPATLELLDEHRPELIIFGKSMVLHREPVAAIRRFIDDQSIRAVLMYDMAHVLGLVGPHFQEPFAEGADLVTGSTHKTFFGTQRGLVGSRLEPHEERYALWESVRRRTFPGSVSNHHLGTMVGLLAAAYEMNHFKDEYQPRVIANAKAFARALADCGLDVAGDPSIDFTETHQVILRVGFGRGPEVAARLETNNVICNYQATPDEEGFTASGALRMGVAEMTRFGMGPQDFQELALLIGDVVKNDARARDAVVTLRSRFQELRYCFQEEQYSNLVQQLHQLI